MAKIKFGAMVLDARNKLDGLVYSKNTFGRYARVKVTPVNRMSQRQVLVRERLMGLALNYANTLTEEQRLAWREFAKVHPRIDVFGDQYTLTGLTMYESLNLVLGNSNDPPIDTPPNDLNVTAMTGITLTIATTPTFSATIAFTPTPAGTKEKVYVFATAPLSTGKNYFKPYFRFISASEKAVTSPFDISSAYVAKFGTPAVGSKIAVLVAFENTENGTLSVGLIDSKIITGT